MECSDILFYTSGILIMAVLAFGLSLYEQYQERKDKMFDEMEDE